MHYKFSNSIRFRFVFQPSVNGIHFGSWLATPVRDNDMVINEVFDATYTAMQRELKRVCEEKTMCEGNSYTSEEYRGIWTNAITPEDEDNDCTNFILKTDMNGLWGWCRKGE